jgi:hypothetical protein
VDSGYEDSPIRSIVMNLNPEDDTMDYDRFCNRCVHRKFRLKEGVLCGLTDKKPDFENECNDFELDVKVEKKEISLSIREIYKKANTALWASAIGVVLSLLLAKNKSNDGLSNNELFTLAIISIPIVVSIGNMLYALSVSEKISEKEQLSKAKRTMLISLILCCAGVLYSLIKLAG